MKRFLSGVRETAHAMRIDPGQSPRLRRIRFMSRLLDTSIVLPGGYRIGLDPIIGLVPAIGDFVGAGLSFYIIYEAARMGLPKRTLLRMCGNVFIETVVGGIPILGDLFDAAWKANVRNVALVELHYSPMQAERSGKHILFGVIATFLILIGTAFGMVAALLWFLVSLFQ